MGCKRAALRGCFAARGLRYTDDAPLPHLLLQKNHGEVLCQGIMNRKSLDNKCASLLKHSLVVTKGSVEEERTLASHDNDHSQSSHDADFITLLSPSITVVILGGDAVTNHNNTTIVATTT